MRDAVLAAFALVGCGRAGFELSDTCTSIGFSVRAADWVPGTIADSHQGNPATDADGIADWYYEQTTGGPLGAPDSWYAQPGALLVWDDSWFGGSGLWAGGNDVTPPIDPSTLIHEVRTDLFPAIPRVRWQNATGIPIDVTVEGTLGVAWLGAGTAGAADVNVDVVIAALDTAGASLGLLFSATVPKPTPGTAEESVVILVRPATWQRLAPGESIAITVRARGAVSTDSWMSLADSISFEARNCQ